MSNSNYSISQMQSLVAAYKALSQIHIESKGDCEKCPLCKRATLTDGEGHEYHFACLYKLISLEADELLVYINEVRSNLDLMREVCQTVRHVFEAQTNNKENVNHE